MRNLAYIISIFTISLFFFPACDTPAEEFAELIAESPCVGNSDARICVNGETYKSQINSPNLHCCEINGFIGKKWCELSGTQKTTVGGEIVSALGLKKTVKIDPKIKVLKYLATHKYIDHCKTHKNSCMEDYIVESYSVQGNVTIDYDLTGKLDVTKDLFKTLGISWDKITFKLTEEKRSILSSKGNMFSLCVENDHKDCSHMTTDRTDYPQMTAIAELSEKQMDWVDEGNNLEDYKTSIMESKPSLILGSVQVNLSEDDILTTVSITTDKGTITSFRPSSLFAGSRVSGLVVTEPIGTTPEEIAMNDGILKGCVVGTEESGTPIDSGHYSIDIPEDLTEGLDMVITDGSGGTVTRVNISDVHRHPGMEWNTKTGDTPTTDFAPDVLQSGRPFVADLPSDGDITNTRVVVQDIPAVVLTESSDGQVITQVPPNVVPGDARIVVIEDGTVFTDEVSVVNVSLAADPYELREGQTTIITVMVCGLANIDVPMQLQLENLNPGILSFQNTTVSVDLEQLDSSGCWTAKFTGIGIRQGDWNVSGTIIQN